LVELRDKLAQKRAAKVTALSDLNQEKGETDIESARYNRARLVMLGRYEHDRKDVEGALLNPDPDEGISSEELHRRIKLFDRHFTLTKSDLEKYGVDTLVDTISPIVKALATDADLAALDLAEAATRDYEALKGAKKDLQREKDEDIDAMKVVKKSRVGLGRQHRSFSLFVESLLVAQDRENDLGRYIKAYEPAYAARRKAGVSIDREPEAAAVNAELGLTPPADEPSPS
jgi:hypothetical protein